jgi:hypothetical protein
MKTPLQLNGRQGSCPDSRILRARLDSRSDLPHGALNADAPIDQQSSRAPGIVLERCDIVLSDGRSSQREVVYTLLLLLLLICWSPTGLNRLNKWCCLVLSWGKASLISFCPIYHHQTRSISIKGLYALFALFPIGTDPLIPLLKGKG